MIDKRNDQSREKAPFITASASRTDGDDPFPAARRRTAVRPDVHVRAVGKLMLVEFVNPHVLFEDEAVQELGRHLERLVGQGNVRLVLDLSTVRYASSAVVGLVASLYRKVNEAGGTLRLFGLNPVLRDAIRICRLDRVIEVYIDESEAIDDSRSTAK
jgi:anti-sigma B factor antagonist